jgi:hypothetical protein
MEIRVLEKDKERGLRRFEESDIIFIKGASSSLP